MEESPDKNPIMPPLSSQSSNKVILILVFAISFLSVFVPDRGFYGLSWDEAYYYKPSREAASWLYRVLLTKDRPLSRENPRQFPRSTDD